MTAVAVDATFGVFCHLVVKIQQLIPATLNMSRAVAVGLILTPGNHGQARKAAKLLGAKPDGRFLIFVLFEQTSEGETHSPATRQKYEPATDLRRPRWADLRRADRLGHPIEDHDALAAATG